MGVPSTGTSWKETGRGRWETLKIPVWREPFDITFITEKASARRMLKPGVLTSVLKL